MYQFFSKPDRYFGACGDLRCELKATRVPGVPVFMRGTRALFVTDLHATKRTTDADIAALKAKLAGVRADILLYGGDFADEAEHAIRLLRGLSGLTAPLGVYAVVGNNDREAFENIDELRRLLREAGIRLLVNEAVTLSVNGGKLVVAGLDEYKYGNPDATGLYPGEVSADTYRLLLSHYPVAVKPMPDLMLSGHTHGGQFNAFGTTPYTIGFERILKRRRAARFVEGLHRHGDGWMLVGKGIGASRIPLRVGVEPEVNLIEFD